MKARDLNPSQRRALRRIVDFYRERNSYSGCTSVRFALDACGRSVSVIVKTRRSDCDRYSPRAVICEERAHFFIGQRGGIRIASADSGLRDESKHVAFMLKAKEF